MKKPQPDLNERLKDTFVAKTGANRKLKRLWGTDVVNGVEVLHARRHYHKTSARPDNYEKLFKFLKVYEDIKDYKGEGVKSAWFTLNKSIGPEDLSTSSSYIADNLNRMWWDSNDGAMPENLTLTTSVVVHETFSNSGSVSGIDWGASKEVLKQYFVDNYETVWDNKKIVQEGTGVINKGSIVDTNTSTQVPDEDDLSPDDPWMAILSRYALRDSGVPCTIKDIEVGLDTARGAVYNTVVITIEIPYIEFNISDPIVQRVLNDLSITAFPTTRGRFSRGGAYTGFVSSNEHVTQTLAKQVNYYETADDKDATVVSRSYLQWEDSTMQASVYETLWLKDGSRWYLRADAIDNPKSYGLTHVELNTYIFGLLDTGYKKDKVPVWKKIVAVVVFIVAVVLTYLSFGTMTGYTAPIMAAAYSVLIGALVVSLVTLAFSAIGMNEWAMAFASVSKDIEPLVTIATIIMVIDIIGSAATTISEVGVSGLVESVVAEMATNFATGLADLMAGSITTEAIAVVNKAVSVYSSVQLSKIDSINSRNKDLKAEYDKLAEETEMDSDVMRGYMSIYAKPATSDWSMYSSTFDLPYERGGGVLAMGNIQRTTKQATRKPDYDEPMFDSLNFI